MYDVIEQILENDKIIISEGNQAENKCCRIIRGNIPVMLSAPHAVSHFRNGKIKYADTYTGGIALYLQKITGCHLIYATYLPDKDPNFDEQEKNEYQILLKKYLQEMKATGTPVEVLFDLHGVLPTREFAIELGTAPSSKASEAERKEDLTSLHNLKDINDIVINAFERNFANLDTAKKSVWKNVKFTAGDQNTVTKNISENTDTACLQIEINKEYRNHENKAQMLALVNALSDIINESANLDWPIIKRKCI